MFTLAEGAVTQGRGQTELAGLTDTLNGDKLPQEVFDEQAQGL